MRINMRESRDTPKIVEATHRIQRHEMTAVNFFLVNCLGRNINQNYRFELNFVPLDAGRPTNANITRLLEQSVVRLSLQHDYTMLPKHPNLPSINYALSFRAPRQLTAGASYRAILCPTWVRGMARTVGTTRGTASIICGDLATIEIQPDPVAENFLSPPFPCNNEGVELELLDAHTNWDRRRNNIPVDRAFDVTVKIRNTGRQAANTPIALKLQSSVHLGTTSFHSNVLLNNAMTACEERFVTISNLKLPVEFDSNGDVKRLVEKSIKITVSGGGDKTPENNNDTILIRNVTALNCDLKIDWLLQSQPGVINAGTFIDNVRAKVTNVGSKRCVRQLSTLEFRRREPNNGPWLPWSRSQDLDFTIPRLNARKSIEIDVPIQFTFATPGVVQVRIVPNREKPQDRFVENSQITRPILVIR